MYFENDILGVPASKCKTQNIRGLHLYVLKEKLPSINELTHIPFLSTDF